MRDNDNTRMMIVDDEPAIREVLSRTFSDRGFLCDTADGYDDAISKLQSGAYDIAMLDINMPGRSGIDLLQSIMSLDGDVAVIMVTAIADTQTAIGAMRMGAYDYVTKPFNLVEVIMSVERALEKRNLQLDNREYQEHLEIKVSEKTEELRQTFVGAIASLAEALDAKDPYTNGHSQRVTMICEIIAQAMKLDEEMSERIRMAGVLHDLGKIGVPETILNKVGKLSDEEFGIVKTHSVRGEKIIEPFIKDKGIREIVRHHHERYSGGGYPDGISGEEIPVGARIMSVADAYDAMTSDRSYRKAMAPEDAEAELVACSGKQFDPEIVELFIKASDQLPFCPIDSRKKTKA
ncbi:MAG: HD domain-containing phosphohydrolase [Thermoleophilia bacterium]